MPSETYWSNPYGSVSLEYRSDGTAVAVRIVNNGPLPLYASLTLEGKVVGAKTFAARSGETIIPIPGRIRKRLIDDVTIDRDTGEEVPRLSTDYNFQLGVRYGP